MINYPLHDLPGLNNAEIEKYESILLPDGRLYEDKTGKAHSKGGSDVFLPSGSKVYSQKLKLPKEVVNEILDKKGKYKKSPAELSKMFDTTIYQDMMEDNTGRYDKHSLKTAQLMKAKFGQIQDNIFEAQELYKKEKGMKNNSESFQAGGVQPVYNPNAYNRFNSNYFQFKQPLDLNDTVPVQQRSRADGLFGQPLSVEEFQANNPWYDFSNFDPSNPNDVRRFQETYNQKLAERSNRLGNSPEQVISEFGFSGNMGANQLDGKFGEFTSKRILPELTVEPVKPLQEQRIPQIENIRKPIELPGEQEVIRENFDDYEEYPYEKEVKREPVGIDPMRYVNGIQSGLLLSQLATLQTENPYYNFTPTKTATTRFEPINTKQSERAFNIAKESLNNTNLPETVKQAKLSQINANMAQGVNQVDLANYQGNLQNQNNNTTNLINTYNNDARRRDGANIQYLRDRARTRDLYQQAKNQYVTQALDIWKSNLRVDADRQLLSELANNYNIGANGQISYEANQGNINQFNQLSGFNQLQRDPKDLTKAALIQQLLQNQ